MAEKGQTTKLAWADISVIDYLDRISQNIQQAIEDKAQAIALASQSKTVNSSHVNQALIALDLLPVVGDIR